MLANGTAASDRTCTSCASGSFSTTANAASCTSWTSCAAGSYVSASGSATTDRVCSACTSGSFSTTADASACTAWTTCPAGTYVTQQGSTTSDRTCTACANGSYSSKANQPSCTAWGTCPAGTYESTAGTSTSAPLCTAGAGKGDNLADAVVIPNLAASTSWSATVDMTNMTFEPGETSASNPAEYNAGAVPRRTRWWSYTPTTTGAIRLTASLSTGLEMSVSIRGSASVSAPFLASCGAWYADRGCSTSLTLTA